MKNIYLIWTAMILFVGFLDVLSVQMLKRIEKKYYRNYWNKQNKENDIFFPNERKIYFRYLTEVPYWVYQNKSAKFWMIVLRFSQVLGGIVVISPFIFIIVKLLFS